MDELTGVKLGILYVLCLYNTETFSVLNTGVLLQFTLQQQQQQQQQQHYLMLLLLLLLLEYKLEWMKVEVEEVQLRRSR